MRKIVSCAFAFFFAQGFSSEAFAQECDFGGGGTLQTWCDSTATQLPASLPSFAGGSSLQGLSGLLGNGRVTPRPGGTRPNIGVTCPTMVVCSGTAADQWAYREVDIDAGAFGRTSLVTFWVNAIEAVNDLSAASVSSVTIASLQMTNPTGELTLDVSLGDHTQENPLALRAYLWLESTGQTTPLGKQSLDGNPLVTVYIASVPNVGMERFYVYTDSRPVVDTLLMPVPLRASFGRPTVLRYGNVGTVSEDYPDVPAVALMLHNWTVRIGDLIPYIGGSDLD